MWLHGPLDCAAATCRGLTPDQRFMLGSRLGDLEECRPSATAFPTGSLFTSTGSSRAVQSGPMGAHLECLPCLHLWHPPV
jgi:hypothetical protein